MTERKKAGSICDRARNPVGSGSGDCSEDGGMIEGAEFEVLAAAPYQNEHIPLNPFDCSGDLARIFDGGRNRPDDHLIPEIQHCFLEITENARLKRVRMDDRNS